MSVMEIACPNCALKFPLAAGINDANARRVAALMGEIPPALAGLVLEYLTLFKPPKSGLTWARTHKLLLELAAGIKTGQVVRSGHAWAAPAEAWQSALQEVLDRRHKFTLPLKGHGYLFEVLAGAAEKQAGQRERTGTRPETFAECSHDEGPVRTAADIKADLHHFQKLLEASPKNASAEYLKGQVSKLEQELRSRQETG